MAKDGQQRTSYQLIDLVQKLGEPRILVLGDLILDRYVWGDAERVSQEAPVILLREERQEVRLGGAANVANLLRGLDVQADMAGVVGADADARDVRRLLEDGGVGCAAVISDPSRPTTVKERYLGRAQYRHPHQMLRVDREVRTPLSPDIEKELLANLKQNLSDYDAILISDYAKGVCTPRVVSRLIESAKAAGIPVIIDPSSSGDCSNFVGATAITPNRLETRRATGMEIATPADAFAAGQKLCSELDLEYVFVTLDSEGIALTRADGTQEMLPTRRREVYDITGAGDMVLAMIGVGAAAGIEPANLGRLANIAGGLEVEQIGVVSISREEILADLLTGARGHHEKTCSLEVAVRHVEARAQGEKIVFTNGCFDLLHVGHASYLSQAAAEGDCLIVGLNSDSSVQRLGKAPDRPIFEEQHRAAMLAALQSVDYVIIFDEDTPHTLLERLRPDVLVKGGTYTREEIVGREVVEAYGGEVKPLGEVPGVSTTILLERLRGEHARGKNALPRVTDQPERKAG